MAKVYDTATDIITFARLQSQNTTSGSSYLGSDGLLKFAAEDEPRIEYAADGSLKGLLIEEQRTNFITYSEDFANVAWLKSGDATTISSTLTASPDGQTNGRKVTFSATSNLLRFIGPSCSVGETYTASVWLKAGTLNSASLAVLFSGGGLGYVSETKTLTSEWQRFSVTSTVPSGTPNTARFRITATGAGSIEVYGAQLEQGSFPTSYIPTSGSQSTRSPDIASIPVSAFGYNQTAGTVVVEWEKSSPTGALHLAASFNPVSIGSYIALGGSVGWYSSGFGLTQDASPNKQAASFDAQGGFSSCDNGNAVNTSSSSDWTGGSTTLHIGNRSGADRPLNGHIKSLSYFPRRLTDAQLQELTS